MIIIVHLTKRLLGTHQKLLGNVQKIPQFHKKIEIVGRGVVIYWHVY